MKSLPTINSKIRVNFFQRKPRKGFSFSVEFIFDDIRERLANKIEANTYISGHYNDGYYSKFVNIIEAAFRQGRDVNHITGEIHFLNLLMLKKRGILTILDCGMMNRKTGVAKKIIQWLYLVMPVKKAEIITAISETTKQEIITYTGCDPHNIRVIPVAINPIYQPDPKVFNKEKPVILHIGTGYNKNLSRMIEAIEGINCHLTIVGKLSDDHIKALKIFNIHYSNEYNIPDSRILEKYRECDILSFISTTEGFGMPIIEANAIERVVITSNISSMPEVAANAACLVDPYNIKDIRSGVMKVINDDSLRESLIDNGKINKLRFDGDKIANMYFELYNEIYNS
jgi:glycosyltransferase involved in cell wall biosynthesis